MRTLRAVAAGTARRRHDRPRAATDPATGLAAGRTGADMPTTTTTSTEDRDKMEIAMRTALGAVDRNAAPAIVTTVGAMMRAATTSHHENRRVEMHPAPSSNTNQQALDDRKNATTRVRDFVTRTELQAANGAPSRPAQQSRVLKRAIDTLNAKQVHGARTAAGAQRGAQSHPETRQRRQGTASDTKPAEPTRRRDDEHKPREAVDPSSAVKEAPRDRRHKDADEKKLVKRPVPATVYDESSEAYWKKHHEANRMDIKWLVWQADADISGFMADFAAQELANISQRIQSHEHQLAQWERGDDLPDLPTL
ncbi:hypothetical protein SDRG_01339 [Saprolegnia diclina VS20]|uniref:Uncharacterized protein n=1 Tax=Saprolegnia diclina (strain VS20) TaxID=1156394 RepID=T0R330_SAPDV|nr:hypothetical protein SDRG_01339 [Saprolegnia diclina VS20]EQC41366.1 hypothetical protein SDRG_01339 [Saprolegnia diclina VS20]|eukprot:XP_008605080.1 hypothetical protein SDRG_01339 [Saprolegnia diclina VS20]